MTPAPHLSSSFRHNEILSDAKSASLRDSDENNYGSKADKMPPIVSNAKAKIPKI